MKFINFKVVPAYVLLYVVSSVSAFQLRHGQASRSNHHAAPSTTAQDFVFERIWIENEKRPPPTYFRLLFEHLTLGHQPGQNSPWLNSDGAEGERTLLQSLLPSRLRHGVAFYNFSSIEINTDFHSIQLLFTLRTDAAARNFSESHVTLYIKSPTGHQHHHFLWTETRQFYAINLTHILRNLNEEPIEMLELELKLSNDQAEILPLDLLFDFEVNPPFLLIHQYPLQFPSEMEIGKKIAFDRRKRSPSERSNTGRRSRSRYIPRSHQVLPDLSCRREEWLVKPSDIGLDDIIAPPILDLGFCTGKCPFPLLNEVYNFSLHSYFIDRHRVLESLSTPEKLPASSCVAVSYKPLMVMEGGASGAGHIVAIHHNALVQSCGCRY